MLINLGQLNGMMELDLWVVQSKQLPKLILLELIFLCSCAKILKCGELLVWLGLELCAEHRLELTLESMKKDKMSYKLPRLITI